MRKFKIGIEFSLQIYDIIVKFKMHIIGKGISMLIKDLIETKPPPVTIRRDKLIQDAMRLLIDKKIGSLVVLDSEDKTVGIITERDIFHLAFRYRGDMMDMTVGDNMSDRIFHCVPDDDIDFAAKLMTQQHIRHVPILDKQNMLCGIVSIGDVIKVKAGNLAC
jgi:CBS domain-containing protein